MVEDNSISNNLIDDRSPRNNVKIQIVPAAPKTLSHLPTRPAVDLAFHNLTYQVKEGRKSSKYIKLLLLVINN